MKPHHHDNQQAAADAEHAIDPVCGMTVDPQHAAGSSQYVGETIYFCSLGCKAKFDANPAAYVSGGSPAPRAVSADAVYICPMDPEIRQKGPGACPKCGMALEREMVSAPTTKTEWTCPMHPEIVRDAPGSCPICGMALEPRTVTLEDENPELKDMSRRFWVSTALTVPLVIFAMLRHLPGVDFLPHSLMTWASWIE